MKTGSALLIAFAFLGCGSGGVDDFSGVYVGQITETYTCATASDNIQLILPNESYTISQQGTSVAVTIASCGGAPFDGVASSNDVEMASETAGCVQPSSNTNDVVTVDAVTGGTLELSDPTTLQVSLTETATVNGDSSCSGTASGTLILQ